MHRAADDMGNDHYTERADEMDEDYVAAWRDLTPAMRQRMARLGIKGPMLNSTDSKQGTRDVSDFVELKAPLPPITERQRLADEIAERFSLAPYAVEGLIEFFLSEIDREAERRKTDHLARVLAGLLTEDNVKVSVLGLAYALDFQGLPEGMRTMRAAAKVVNTSPAYISQCANGWCDLLDLPRPAAMKTQGARKAYKKARKQNHWRKQVCPTLHKPK